MVLLVPAEPPSGVDPLEWTTKRNNTHPSWWRDRGLRRLSAWLAWTWLAALIGGYDGTLLNGLQGLETWNVYFGRPHGSLLGLITASQSLGGIPSGPLAAMVGDRWGRKAPVAIGAVITIIGVIIQTCSTSVGMFLGSRVLVGFGSGMNATLAPVLSTELAHVRYRGPAVTLCQSCFYLGAVLSGWVTYATIHMAGNWSWRLPVLLQAVSSLAMLFFVRWAPESPRWLVSQGRDEEALHLLAYYHANGDESDELVRFEFGEIKAAVKVDQQHTVGWKELVRTPGNRRRVALVFFIGVSSQINGLGIIAYYLAPILRTIGIDKPSELNGLNAGLALFNLFAAIGGALLVDRVGRRRLWLVSTTGLLISMCFITALSATYAKTARAVVGRAVVGFIFVFDGFYDLAYTGLTISYPNEILPYHLRAKGFSIGVTSAFVALMVNQYVNPVALEALGYKFYYVYIVILVAILVIQYLYFPETRNYTLEEINRLFDPPTLAGSHPEAASPHSVDATLPA